VQLAVQGSRLLEQHAALTVRRDVRKASLQRRRGGGCTRHTSSA
jgi:hypothetical protein